MGVLGQRPVVVVRAVLLHPAVFGEARLVTGLSPAGAQFQVVDPLHVAQKLFARDAPGRRERREIAPAVAGSQLRGAVGAEIGRHEVLAVEIVRHARQVGHDRPLRLAVALAADAAVVAAIQIGDGVVVGGREIGARSRELLPHGGRGRCAGHHFETVAVEGLVPGQDVVVDHAHVVGAGVRGGSVLRPAVGGADRVEERRRVDPAAVHRNRRFEGQPLGQIEGQASGKQQTVGDILVIVRAGHVFERRREVGAVEIIVVLLGVLGVPDRRIGRGRDGRNDHAGTVGALSRDDGTLGGVVREGGRGVGRNPFEDLLVEAGLHVVAVRRSGADDTRFVGVAAAEVVGRILVAVGDRELVVLVDARRIGFVEPVGDIGERLGKSRYGAVLLHQFAVLPGVEHVEALGHLRDADEGRERDLGSHLPAALLGGDEHHAVGGARTVDGGRRGVFQHLHRLDLVGREVSDGVVALAHGNAVNHIERVVARRDGRSAAHADHHALTGRAVGLDDLHTGGLALQGSGSRGDRTAREVVGLDDRHSRREVLLFDRTVTDRHHGVEGHGVFAEFHVHLRAAVQGDRLRDESQRLENQVSRIPPPFEFEGISAVYARRGTVGGALLDDRSPDDGLSRLVGDRSRHGRPLLGQDRSRHDQHSRRKQQHPSCPAARLQLFAYMYHRKSDFRFWLLL